MILFWENLWRNLVLLRIVVFLSLYFVSYKATIIESKYIKSGTLTMQNDYKDEIVLVAVDMEECNVMLGWPWHMTKDIFLAVERNKHFFHDNGIRYAIVLKIIDALVILPLSPPSTESLPPQIKLQTTVGHPSPLECGLLMKQHKFVDPFLYVSAKEIYALKFWDAIILFTPSQAIH